MNTSLAEVIENLQLPFFLESYVRHPSPSKTPLSISQFIYLRYNEKDFLGVIPKEER